MRSGNQEKEMLVSLKSVGDIFDFCSIQIQNIVVDTTYDYSIQLSYLNVLIYPRSWINKCNRNTVVAILQPTPVCISMLQQCCRVVWDSLRARVAAYLSVSKQYKTILWSV